MKLPTSFVPDKDLDQNVEDIINDKNVETLLDSCKKFLNIITTGKGGYHSYNYNLVEEKDDAHIYKEAEWLSEGIKYTKNDLKKFSQKIITKEEADLYLGFYLSALINKVVQEGNKLTLKLNKDSRLYGIGRCLNNITLTIKGNVGDSVGQDMENGKLHVEGCTGNCAGDGIKKGTLIIRGNTGLLTGECMEEDGKIKVYGKIGSISENEYFGCKGRIYQKNKLIWPK